MIAPLGGRRIIKKERSDRSAAVDHRVDPLGRSHGTRPFVDPVHHRYAMDIELWLDVQNREEKTGGNILSRDLEEVGRLGGGGVVSRPTNVIDACQQPR